MYEEALTTLTRLLNNAVPETAIMDFEIGFHQAFRAVFPDSIISACFFHLCENIRRKISEVAVRDDHQLATSMAMFRALAFVPLNHVERAFVLLFFFLNHLVELYSERDDYLSIMGVCDYFEETYVGKQIRNRRNRRNQPLFARELWNMYEKTVEGDPRTNNSVEGGHNKLHSFFDCDHPSFFKFLDLLRKHVKRSVEDRQKLFSFLSDQILTRKQYCQANK